jgi:23S rRNA pseudouridine1911/1915/1917 synthase
MIQLVKQGEWLEGVLPSLPDDITYGQLLREYWKWPKKTVHLLFQHKEILVDGHPVSQMSKVAAGKLIRFRLCPPEPYGVEPWNTDVNVVYEDDHCLVVDKPAGLLLHPADSAQRRTLDHAVAGYLQHKGIQTKVRHIHRLDQDTSGLVLYGKHALAAALLDDLLRQREISRTYVAFVHGRMTSSSGTIDAPIGKDRHHSGRRRVDPRGERAVTHFQVLKRYAQATQVECRLDTGRTHQIRVHLAHTGHPLVGDVLYGGSDRWINRQALHAFHLRWKHPFTGETIAVHAPWPDDLQQLERHLEGKLSRTNPGNV